MTTSLPRPVAPAPQPPTPQRPAPRSGRQFGPDQRHWLSTAAVFAAVLLTSLSLNSVLMGWTWLNPLAFTVGSVLVIMGAARSLRLPGALVPVAGLLALVGSMVVQYFPAQSFLGIFPGEGSASRLTVLLNHAENTVVSQVAPVLPGTGIYMVVCAGVGLIAVLADTLATTLRMPATSGLALLAILTVPAVVRPQSVGMPGFLAAVVGFLIILGCGQWRDSQTAGASRDASGGRLARGLAIGAAALAVTIFVPLAIPGFNVGMFPQGARMNLWGTATGLNPVVTLGNDLRNPTGFGRITYATDSPEALYLRAVTLENFDGERWAPDQRYSIRRPGVTEMGTDEVRNAMEDGVVTTRITTDTFTSPWLLAPYAPVGFTNLSGRWSWDPLNHSVIATDDGSTAQQQYDVASAGPELSRERLQAIGPVPEAAVDSQFLDLPDTTPEIVRETAEELTAGIDNPYEQALAIQNHLRGPAFTYSVDAPVEGGYDGNSLDVVARFLESRSGYCVHYAGAMAVMARLAGIPSRVAVGYAPGTPTGESVTGPDGIELTEFTVTSLDAHAWPELYFDDVGWVKFEPTPSRGVVPDYAQNEFTPGVPEPNVDDLAPGGNPLPAPGATGNADPGTGNPQTSAETAERARETSALVTAALIGAVLLGLAPLVVRGVRRRNRRRKFAAAASAGAGALLTWAEVVDLAADYGHAALPTDTPRTFAARLSVSAGLTGVPASALTRLRSGYEAAEYAAPTWFPAPTADPVLPAVVDGWEDVETIAGALRATSGRLTRVRALLLPRSLSRSLSGNARSRHSQYS